MENPPNEGCFSACRTAGFDGFYQVLEFPAKTASTLKALINENRRILRRSTIVPPGDRELTATPMLYPFRGISKGFSKSAEGASFWWGTALWIASAGVGAALLANGTDVPHWWVLIALAVVAGVAERQSVLLFSHGDRAIEVSGSFLPFVFTAVAFGPLAALVVGGAAQLGDLRRPYLRWYVYTPIRALTGAATGLMVGFAPTGGFAALLIASFVAALTNLFADASFNIATGLVRRTTTAMAYLRTVGPLFVFTTPLYTPVVAGLVYGYERYSLAAAVAFLVPAVALQRVIHLYQEQRIATDELASANRQLERANLSFAAALVATLDARDEYTAGHSTAVAIYSRDIARRMGLPEVEQQRVYMAGLVHDIGKIGLPPGLLEKAGPLTLEERRVMQRHSEIGQRILEKVDDYADIATIVRHHHERVDGVGYPDALVGEEIPLLSRIIAVADAYNAMTSDRPYREAMASRVARLRLAQAVGSQFDTSVVAAFEAILATAEGSYLDGTRSDFSLSADEDVVSPPLVALAAGA